MGRFVAQYPGPFVLFEKQLRGVALRIQIHDEDPLALALR